MTQMTTSDGPTGGGRRRHDTAPPPSPLPDRWADRDPWLQRAAVLFAVASAVHIADHLRRGQGSVTDALLAAGNLALVLQVVVVTLVLVRHRLARSWPRPPAHRSPWGSPPPTGCRPGAT